LVDCDVLVFVDSTGKPNCREEMLSPYISLDKPEGAVLMASEEAVVDADGDSGLVIGMVRGSWSMSVLGFVILLGL
jgi:hypothetical protein